MVRAGARVMLSVDKEGMMISLDKAGMMVNL